MIRYTDIAIGFREVPNEVSLLINISNCPHQCKGCHTPYLQKDVGDDLTEKVFMDVLERHIHEITCICFLGEGNDIELLGKLIEYCNRRGLKSCLYTGGTDADDFIRRLPTLNYIKTGPYIEDKGGLDQETTNQKFFKIQWNKDDGGIETYTLSDMTHLFQKNNHIL